MWFLIKGVAMNEDELLALCVELEVNPNSNELVVEMLAAIRQLKAEIKMARQLPIADQMAMEVIRKAAALLTER